MLALVNNNVILEIFDDDIEGLYHPDFIAQLVEVDNSVQTGDFLNPLDSDPPINGLRERMIIRADVAQLRLVKLELFEKIDDAIMALPRGTPLRILWEKAPDYRRLDPNLIEFLTGFGFNDEDIDNLFL